MKWIISVIVPLLEYLFLYLILPFTFLCSGESCPCYLAGCYNCNLTFSDIMYRKNVMLCYFSSLFVIACASSDCFGAFQAALSRQLTYHIITAGCFHNLYWNRGSENSQAGGGYALNIRIAARFGHSLIELQKVKVKFYCLKHFHSLQSVICFFF